MTVPARFAEGIAPVTGLDRADLREFMERWYGPGARQLDPASDAWRFTNHPLSRPGLSWICRRDGHIVGHQAGIPFALTVEGSDMTAAWAVDLMVDARWRMRGVGPGLTNALVKAQPVVVGLGIADNAQRAFRRAGWRDLGQVPRWQRLLRPVPDSLAGPGLSKLSRIAAVPLAAADAVVGSALRAAGWRAKPMEGFDIRAEAVWRDCASHHKALARRDLASLSWRFDRSPHAACYQRWLLVRANRAVGWFVLRFGTERRLGVQRCLLVDYLCPPALTGVVALNAIALARKGGAEILEVLAPEHLGPWYKGLGFVRRPGHRLMVHAAPGVDGLPGDPAGWFVTMADSDLDHLPLGEEMEAQP